MGASSVEDDVGRGRVVSLGVISQARLAAPVSANGIIPRSRLFDRLSSRPVIVVAGMAGYGKSCLVSSWLTEREPPGSIAWLTLDVGDQDPGRLASDLLAALRASRGQALTTALEGLHAPPLFADPLRFVDSMQEALYDSAAPLTLVLDDVQHVSSSNRALEIIDHFLQWAPTSARVILSGRTVPPLRLQRLRLEDRLEFVSHRDMAFTSQETAAAVAEWDVRLSPDGCAALHEATQGWPAAVRMAALTSRPGPDESQVLELRRDDALADYLTTEVLASLDDEMCDFVVGATVDELVCPSLANVLLGVEKSEKLLERCATEGLFLTREARPGVEPWYRWHSLFAAHMHTRRRVVNAAWSRDLELRAAVWWSTVDTAKAVNHALDGGDADLAARILSSAWLELALDGRADTVLSLVASIPPGVDEAAELHLALAFVAAQAGHTDTARVEMATARMESTRLSAEARARFETRAVVIDLFLVDDRVALADAVSAGRGILLEAGSGQWTFDRVSLALVQLYLGMGEARIQDDVPHALRLLREAAESARSVGLGALELAALAETCVPSITEGDLDATGLLAHRVLKEAEARGWGDLPSVAPALGYLGWLHFWQGDASQARVDLDRTLSLLRPSDWGMRGLALCTLAQACLLVGDVAEAEAIAQRAHELTSPGRMPPWWPSLLGAVDATIWLARGELDAAVTLAMQRHSEPSYHLAECLRGVIMLRGGHAQDCLDTVSGIPSQWRLPHIAVLVDVLSAQALYELGRVEESHVCLERAIAASSTFGLLTPYLIVGPGLIPLLRDHLRQGTAHPEFVPPLLTRLAAPATATVNEWGESLTEREMAIVRYLTTSLSNSEIADAEFISVNTAKTHIAHVYRKLGVSSRRAAVRRAGELGLI